MGVRDILRWVCINGTHLFSVIAIGFGTWKLSRLSMWEGLLNLDLSSQDSRPVFISSDLFQPRKRRVDLPRITRKNSGVKTELKPALDLTVTGWSGLSLMMIAQSDSRPPRSCLDRGDRSASPPKSSERAIKFHSESKRIRASSRHNTHWWTPSGPDVEAAH